MSKQYQTSLDELIYIRRTLHINPELSFEEYNTQEYILNYIQEYNFEIKKINTGVLVYIDLGFEDIIAFRSEMDALPIKEKNNCVYKSINSNMHACGHDGHMAILLLLSKYIYHNKDKLSHNYLLIFQSSEEKYGGALSIIKSDFFQKHLPKYIFALHVFPHLKKGKIYSRSGSFLAMCVEIDIIIKGKSTHIQNINEGIDSIKIASELSNQLYTYFDKLNKAKTRFLIGQIIGGKARNICSDEAMMKITLRNYYKKNYLDQRKFIINLAEYFINKYQCDINIIFNDDFDPVYNDGKLFKIITGKYQILNTTRKIIGDDFSQYQKVCPTNYSLLGTGNTSFLHEEDFDFDEKILLSGLDYFINLLNI